MVSHWAIDPGAASEELVRPFGMIRWVISDGLVDGDPNILVVEAEGPTGTTPPAMIRLQGLQGIFGVWLSADDDQEKGTRVGWEETAADKEPSKNSGGHQNQKTPQTDMGIKEVQQPLEKTEGQVSANVQDIQQMSGQTSSVKDGAEESSKLRNHKKGDIQQEGLVYGRKKVGIKHESAEAH